MRKEKSERVWHPGNQVKKVLSNRRGVIDRSRAAERSNTVSTEWHEGP